jgi:hypothetical protein
MTDYGDDIAGIDDVDSELSWLEGTNPRVVVEAAACEFGSMPGSMEDDPSWGYDLTACIGDTTDAAEVTSKLEDRLRANDRIEFSKVTVVATGTGGLTVTIQLQPVQGKAFELVLGVSSLSVDVIGIREAA